MRNILLIIEVKNSNTISFFIVKFAGFWQLRWCCNLVNWRGSDNCWKSHACLFWISMTTAGLNGRLRYRLVWNKSNNLIVFSASKFERLPEEKSERFPTDAVWLPRRTNVSPFLNYLLRKVIDENAYISLRYTYQLSWLLLRKVWIFDMLITVIGQYIFPRMGFKLIYFYDR